MIRTELTSRTLRERSIDLKNEMVLISRLAGSKQEEDLSEPTNCGGLGRIRHFKVAASPGWPRNPLPILPAARALGLGETDRIEALVFQNAACNWRCWYCYVPYKLLSADSHCSEWVSAGRLIDLYLSVANRPPVIDLSGGSPDLVPEWVPWTMRELLSRGMEDDVYLWSDDNLSTEYLFDLDPSDIDLLSRYRNYGRVCCFKGYDDESFTFNTGAAPDGFRRQFEIAKRLRTLGIDLYAYVTLTTPGVKNLGSKIRRLMDWLQEVHENFPLRVVPLEISYFSPMRGRLKGAHELAMRQQWEAVSVWIEELEKRFSEELRKLGICDVSIR